MHNYDGREGPSLMCAECGNAMERWSDARCDGAMRDVMRDAMERCAMRYKMLWSDARCDAMRDAMERCAMRSNILWSDT